MGVGFLSGRTRAHQFVVALDLQLAAVEHCIVAQVGVKTDILAGRRVLMLPQQNLWGDSGSGSRPKL